MIATAWAPHEPITRHVRTSFTRLRPEQTVGEVLTEIRDRGIGERITYFYVVDCENRLHGVVPTRRLLQSPLSQPVAEVMVRDVVTVPSSATVLEACNYFTQHRLLALPVIEQGRIVGVVDAELYTGEVGNLEAGDQRDDLFQLIGVHAAELRRGSPLMAFRMRFPWLLCSVLGGLMAAFVSGIFEAELQKAVTLALFIPVVLAVAESVSVQSVSLALQGLRGHEPTLRSLRTKLMRELMTGTMLGTACALVVAGVATLWLGKGILVVCVLAGMSVGVACAAVIGVAMPNLLRLLQRNPQVAAGPVALALSDAITLVVYFNCARVLMS